jgi:hypothetical protein
MWFFMERWAPIHYLSEFDKHWLKWRLLLLVVWPFWWQLDVSQARVRRALTLYDGVKVMPA